MSSSSTQNEPFNSMLFVASSPLQSKYYSPLHDKTETDSNSHSNSSQSQQHSSPYINERYASEACLSLELLHRLDECSPLKTVSPPSPQQQQQQQQQPELFPYINEKNYLFECYLDKNEKENKNINQQQNTNTNVNASTNANNTNTMQVSYSFAKKLTFNSNDNKNLNMNSYCKSKNKKRNNKMFLERQGDWECKSCKNFNFSFRKVCNKCGYDKEKTDKQYETIATNVLTMLNHKN